MSILYQERGFMKRKCDYFVYSAFSVDLQDYPYRPFIAKTHDSALAKFVSFISNRDTVAPNLELHCIGECQVNSEGIIDGSVQPFIIPYRVATKQNIISKTYLLSQAYINLVKKYLYKLINLEREEKCKIQHKKNLNCTTVKK